MEAIAQKPGIVLVPIGTVPSALLDYLAASLSATFARPCRLAVAIPIPTTAYDQCRGQYVAPSILMTLARLDIKEAERLLGVIDADCYATGLNFVFGQATVHSREAFIALPRLRQSFYGLPEDETLFYKRAVKEAVHELGHTYGLGHCPETKCVMHFSNSLYDTDVKEEKFCTRCAAQLQKLTKGAGH